MGHFQRWFTGLFLSIIGVLNMAIGLALVIAGILSNDVIVVFGSFTVAAGAVMTLYGNYIMEEEKPRGRYRIEQ